VFVVVIVFVLVRNLPNVSRFCLRYVYEFVLKQFYLTASVFHPRWFRFPPILPTGAQFLKMYTCDNLPRQTVDDMPVIPLYPWASFRSEKDLAAVPQLNCILRNKPLSIYIIYIMDCHVFISRSQVSWFNLVTPKHALRRPSKYAWE
jgi:hypothetical protein